jgi:hypothetical protein
MGSTSTQAVPVSVPEVEKSDATRPAPQPERSDAPFAIKLISGIPG